jgi:regulator of RNase E activity RraA
MTFTKSRETPVKKYQGGDTRPGRIDAGAINIRRFFGDVMIRPGDCVITNGDGMVILPQEYRARVAGNAWDIANGDKKDAKAF